MPKPSINYNRQARPQKTRAYMKLLETVFMESRVGSKPTKVYQYYLSIAHKDYPDFTDKSVAEVFGWSESIVKRARHALMSNGYFKKTVFRAAYPSKEVAIYYFLGRDQILQNQLPDNKIFRSKSDEYQTFEKYVGKKKVEEFYKQRGSRMSDLLWENKNIIEEIYQ